MGRVVGGEEATHGLHHHEVVGGCSGSPQFKATPQLHVGGKLNRIGSLEGRGEAGGQNLIIIPTLTYMCIRMNIIMLQGCHILYAIFNTGQKISMLKFLSMRAGGEIGENFIITKISTYMYMYTVPTCTVYLSCW